MEEKNGEFLSLFNSLIELPPDEIEVLRIVGFGQYSVVFLLHSKDESGKKRNLIEQDGFMCGKWGDLKGFEQKNREERMRNLFASGRKEVQENWRIFLRICAKFNEDLRAVPHTTGGLISEFGKYLEKKKAGGSSCENTLNEILEHAKKKEGIAIGASIAVLLVAACVKNVGNTEREIEKIQKVNFEVTKFRLKCAKEGILFDDSTGHGSILRMTLRRCVVDKFQMLVQLSEFCPRTLLDYRADIRGGGGGGGSKRLLPQRDFNEVECQRLMLSLARGLDFLHSRKLYHNDLRFSNVLVTTSGWCAKLIDLGFTSRDLAATEDYAHVREHKKFKMRSNPDETFSVYFDCLRLVIIMLQTIFESDEYDEFILIDERDSVIGFVPGGAKMMKKKKNSNFHFLVPLIEKLDLLEPDKWLTAREIVEAVENWGKELNIEINLMRKRKREVKKLKREKISQGKRIRALKAKVREIEMENMRVLCELKKLKIANKQLKLKSRTRKRD